MSELTKKQIEIALKDINSVGQNIYNIYCFTNNCDNRIETDEMIMYLNTVSDSIKVIKQVLKDKYNEL